MKDLLYLSMVSKGFYNDSIKGLYIGTLPCADCLGNKNGITPKRRL